MLQGDWGIPKDRFCQGRTSSQKKLSSASDKVKPGQPSSRGTEQGISKN